MFAFAYKSLAHERIDEGINNYPIDFEQKDLVAYYRSWKVADISRAVLKYYNIRISEMSFKVGSSAGWNIPYLNFTSGSPILGAVSLPSGLQI